MNLLSARNPHDMLPVALDRLFKLGVKRETRNGSALQLPGPTLLCYERPLERVVFWPERDANPFFHLAEAMWMLSGRDDLGYVAKFAAQIKQYSDDGEKLNGAYGYRWRNHFGYDQLDLAIKNLKANPACRRQVIAMWDATSNCDFEQLSDLQNKSSKDLPCNTHAYVAVATDGKLDLTVCNRSNDLVWGCLGANAVHFSFLLEYLAESIGVEVGRYYQFTNNLHGYLETIEPLRELPGSQGLASPYELGAAQVTRLNLEYNAVFGVDLKCLGQGYYLSQYFINVVGPMERVFEEHKKRGPRAALKIVDEVKASDWRFAARQWLERRAARREKAQDDGVSYE